TVNRELFPVAAGNQSPTDFHVWAGYVPDPNFLVHLTRGFPVCNAGVLYPYQIHSSSVDFAVQLNHLGLRLIRCPEATAGVKLEHTFTDGNVVFRSVPLDLRNPTQWNFPYGYLFRNFYTFLDILEVHATPVPPPDEVLGNHR